MDPIVTGALISGGAQLLGGLISSGSNSSSNAMNAQLQREFAQNGIRWRVEDAKAAGLHPLAALGTSGASASPSFVAGDLGESIARAGQSMGDIVSRTRTATEAAIQDAQLESLKASSAKDYAQAAYWTSEAKRAGQVAANPMPASVAPTGVVQVKPDQVISTKPGDPSVTAGQHAGYTDNILSRSSRSGKTLHGVVPYSDDGWSEGKESAEWYDIPEIVRKSAEASGMSAWEWIQRYVLGHDFVDSAEEATGQMAIGKKLYHYFRGTPPKNPSSGGRVTR